MAFGQQSGSPASGRLVQRLLSLLQDAGYSGFRDARGPLGFNQRQGGGKFTGPEAEAFIEQLEAEAEVARVAGEGGPDGPLLDGPPMNSAVPDVAPEPRRRAKPASPRTPTATPPSGAVTPAGETAAARREGRLLATLAEMPAALLARDLESRGWIVIPPEGLTTPEAPA